jgi:4-amino-4-deoxy-L-arabinose transferase-like glycosyltransferase
MRHRARAQAAQGGLGARTLLVVAAIALAVRILYVVLALRGYTPSTDDAHYNDIALKVSQGHGIASQFPYLWTHPTAFRPPLFPVLLGGVYAMFGAHVGVAQALNVVIGTGVVVLVAMLAFRLAGRTAALVAAGVAVVHPALLANDGVILTEPLALLLMLATLLALDRDRYWLAGLFAGLLVLTRPSAQLYVPVLGLYLLISAVRRVGWRQGWRIGLRSAVVFGLVSAVVVAPWVIRNQIELGKPLIVTSNGFNLAAIWSPLALQRGHFIDPIRDPANDSVTRFSQLQNLNEADLDATLRHEGLEGLRSHERQVPRVVGGNLLYLFDVRWRVNDHAERLDGRNIAFRHRTLPFVWLVLIASPVGFALMRRRRLGVLVILTAVYMVGVSVLTVSPPRLRAPYDVLACVAAGVLVAAVQQWRRGRLAPEPATDATSAPSLAGVGQA